jgi:hypothetical protein
MELMTGAKLYFCFFGIFLAGLSMIIGGVISPLLFLFLIIPGIEKRIGVKLEYPKFYDVSPMGKLTRVFEIPLCIASEYFLQFFGKTTKNIKFYKNYALIKADFNIKNFSRLEIFWSVVTVISYIMFFGFAALLYMMGA